ncbi:dihydrolipoyl dehydrogenase family protein [Actinokineospora diospyrosa]|uniref:Pyruvate/2-oxoglutarate dehydrogenase complex, dihydrolipoamide dehydrogenase (E3) component n=1 Tax=Actinokineospora diospyrosa TaxID=103728 RepID=A0ABT1IGD2_9PSEU|nr:NAD(P)/FAD-dependent oxidoreductase [Actinokineospora diospyrosa]MCP2271705.1 Pyruvate/2-oxoglutarate dehydrogenase complex, dihydrolipoamide dehydrogenase (E3) component [Actinokineospora diospyrosa]
MAELVVDVAVVGLGPGGEAVATRLAQAGLSVAGIESRLVGGECPYYACVPTKGMIRAADVLAEARRVPEFAGTAQITPDWGKVAARVRDEITADWNDQAAVDRLEAAGVQVVRGQARITGPGVLAVGEQVVRAARGIVLNPGTDPAVPPIPGLAGTPLWTNRDAVRATAVPDSLIVIGGGPVGCEFAQVFARFGARVTVLQANDRLLPLDEPEASALLAERFAAEHIQVKTGAKITAARHDGQLFTLELDGEDPVSAAQVLVAAGRKSDMAELGIGAYGLDESARGVTVDDHMRAADGLWAIGDVTGKGAFTHMSMYQAAIVASDILGENGPGAEYHAVPRVTFTDPEIGSVGLTEAAARAAGLNVRVGITQLSSSTRGFLHKAEGLIKLIEDADTGVLVGATSAGPTGGEVLGALVVAVHAKVPVDQLRRMIYAYPTFHRAIESALADLRA